MDDAVPGRSNGDDCLCVVLDSDHVQDREHTHPGQLADLLRVRHLSLLALDDDPHLADCPRSDVLRRLPHSVVVGLFVKNKTLQTALLVLCVIPFWTSFLIRVVAWRPMLGKEGATREELNAGKRTVLGFPTNTLIAAQTWMPSICLPAGFTPDGLPVGLEIVVPPYHEPDLFRLGYAFERATGYRRPPGQRTGAVTEPLQSALRLRAEYGSVCSRGGLRRPSVPSSCSPISALRRSPTGAGGETSVYL
jgi:hypothetical protein